MVKIWSGLENETRERREKKKKRKKEKLGPLYLLIKTVSKSNNL